MNRSFFGKGSLRPSHFFVRIHSEMEMDEETVCVKEKFVVSINRIVSIEGFLELYKKVELYI